MKNTARLMLMVFVLICFSGPALAAHSPNLDGPPAAFIAGETTGYFMWQDKEGLHLRTTTSGANHVFTGVIRTNGKFGDILGKTVGTDDYVRIDRSRSEINFRFNIAGGDAGIDLSVKGGTCITFALSMDGEGVDPANIVIGRDGWQPADSKFTLRNDSDKACDHDDRAVLIIESGFWWEWAWPQPHRHSTRPMANPGWAKMRPAWKH